MERIYYLIHKEGKTQEDTAWDKKHQVFHNLFDSKHFREYIDKYGLHFTDKLAEYASSKMVNANGLVHSWKSYQIEENLLSGSISLPKSSTNGDITYLANMYYADFVPSVIKSESDCIKAAINIAEDVDGYEGQAFARWLADILIKGVDIPWEEFI